LVGKQKNKLPDKKKKFDFLCFLRKSEIVTSVFFSSSDFAVKISLLEYLAAFGASLGASLTTIKK